MPFPLLSNGFQHPSLLGDLHKLQYSLLHNTYIMVPTYITLLSSINIRTIGLNCTCLVSHHVDMIFHLPLMKILHGTNNSKSQEWEHKCEHTVPLAAGHTDYPELKIEHSKSNYIHKFSMTGHRQLTVLKEIHNTLHTLKSSYRVVRSTFPRLIKQFLLDYEVTIEWRVTA